MFFVVFLLIIEFILQLLIAYPPTIQQLDLGIISPLGLWIGRIGSLSLILLTLSFITHLFQKSQKQYFWILILASPSLSLLWMSYPLDVLKIFFIFLPFAFAKLNRGSLIVPLLVSISILLFVNLKITNDHPAILKALSFQQSGNEVTHRFLVENGISPRIEEPYILRKMAYNKYFVLLKNVTNESLSFFNFEALFFQEVPPISQKGVVLFFWPEIILFVVGLWIFSTNTNREDRAQLIILSLLSFLYFITTDASVDRRFALALFPLAILMTYAIHMAQRTTWKSFKLIIYIILFVSFYGWLSNVYDRYTRPQYWFDNRPLAYNFIFTSLSDFNYKQYSRVEVPDTLYAIGKYCLYYLNDCPTFTFKNYDLTKETIHSDTLYIGYLGNFIGPSIQNDFPSEYKELFKSNGLGIIAKTHIYDNIANTYGQDLLLVREEGKQ